MSGSPKAQTQRPEARTAGPSPVEALRIVGPLLYGEQWHRAAARLLGVTDRSVRHWLVGSRTAPGRIIPRLEAALRERLASIREYLGGV